MANDKTKCPELRAQGTNENKRQNNSNTLQRNRLLKRLQLGAASTLELRHQEDVLSPAARIFELRHRFGHNIQTDWSEAYNPGGGKHRVAKYALMAGKWQEDAQQFNYEGDFHE